MTNRRFRVHSGPISAQLRRRLLVEVEGDGVARLCLENKTLLLAASTSELEESLGIELRPV